MPPAYDEEEGMGPLEKGRHRYQKKNFQGALVAFTEAVKISTGHLLLTALDHRAATFEKLDQLQSALKDAKQMLELKPELSKGYLRCGKVLQLKGEHQLALKIYERGLNKVKVGTNTDKDRVTLQSVFNKLQRSQAPSKTLDPLSYLPLEMVEIIIQQLDIRERMICLSVSKSWKRVLESSHNLWTTLDTSYTKKQLSQKALRAYLRRSNYTLDEASLKYGTLDALKLQYLTRTCTKLQRFTIHGGNIIGESLISALPLAKSLRYLNIRVCLVSFRSVLESLRHVQSTIVEAHFHRVQYSSQDVRCLWPRLEHLRKLCVYSASRDRRNIALNNLIESIPNIQSLELEKFDLGDAVPLDLRELKSLEVVQLKDSSLKRLPLLPLTLKHLCLNDNLRLSNVQGENCHLPFLEILECENTGLNDKLIVTMLKNSPNLKRVHIGSRLVGDYAAAHHDFPLCESIEELGVKCLQYDEKDFIRMVGKCPNLKTLDISCTKITGVAVKRFVDQGLTSLDIDDCSKISSDAVEYARGKGVGVMFSFAAARAAFRDLTNVF